MTDTATLLPPAATADRPARPVRPIVELLTIAAPTVAQMASYTFMGFIDTVILARYAGLGDVTPTAASANGGLAAFSVISLGMGVMFIVNTLVSQAFGRGDDRSAGGSCGRASGWRRRSAWACWACGRSSTTCSPGPGTSRGWRRWRRGTSARCCCRRG